MSAIKAIRTERISNQDEDPTHLGMEDELSAIFYNFGFINPLVDQETDQGEKYGMCLTSLPIADGIEKFNINGAEIELFDINMCSNANCKKECIPHRDSAIERNIMFTKNNVSVVISSIEHDIYNHFNYIRLLIEGGDDGVGIYFGKTKCKLTLSCDDELIFECHCVKDENDPKITIIKEISTYFK